MQITCEEREAGVVVVACRGALESATVAKLKSALKPWLTATPRHVVIDATALEFIDSTGLGVLLALQRQTQRGGGSLRICAPSRDVTAILEMTKLARVLAVTPTVDAACAHIQKTPRV